MKLPNFTGTCNYICTQRRSRNRATGKNAMVETMFERAKLGEVLDLLKKTMPDVWKHIIL